MAPIAQERVHPTLDSNESKRSSGDGGRKDCPSPDYRCGCGLPDLGPSPGEVFDPATLWWRHETRHRKILNDYPSRICKYAVERKQLETAFIEQTAVPHEHFFYYFFKSSSRYFSTIRRMAFSSKSSTSLLSLSANGTNFSLSSAI